MDLASYFAPEMLKRCSHLPGGVESRQPRPCRRNARLPLNFSWQLCCRGCVPCSKPTSSGRLDVPASNAALPLPALMYFSFLSGLFLSPSDEDATAEIDGEGTQADVSQEQTQDRPPLPPPPQQQQEQPQPPPPSQQKESSILGDLFGFEDLMKPEEPDLVDQCSRSSFTSQNGRGTALGDSALKSCQLVDMKVKRLTR